MNKSSAREKLESTKVLCPDCSLPHNLSSKAIEVIIDLICAEAQGMKKKYEAKDINEMYDKYNSAGTKHIAAIEAHNHSLDNLCARLKGGE